MGIISLDFVEVKTYWELHELFKTTFQLPNYYGRNLDALWDCLYCCYDSNTTILLKNCSAVPEDLQSEVELVKELFRELQEEDGVVVRYEEAEDANISDYLI